MCSSMKQVSEMNHMSGLRKILIPTTSSDGFSPDGGISNKIDSKTDSSEQNANSPIETNGEQRDEDTPSKESLSLNLKCSAASKNTAKTILPNVAHTNSEPSEDGSSKTAQISVKGGTLTFFQEGRPLLELSHRNEKGTWFQVKSKTYWPPSTTAKTSNIINDPFRSLGLHAGYEDFSSTNSSPWSNDHPRKQAMPRKLLTLSDWDFCYVAGQSTKNVLKRTRMKRFSCRPYNINTDLRLHKIGFKSRKQCLNKKIKVLSLKLIDKVGLKIDFSLTINSLLEKATKQSESIDPTFISPRKRYLKHMDTESDHRVRKKTNPIMSNLSQKEMVPPSSPCGAATPKCAMSSPYSIDSILSHETATTEESFLRNILKTDKNCRRGSSLKLNSPKASHGLARTERNSSPYYKESLNERSQPSDHPPELNHFNSTASITGQYMNHYLNTRSWMHPSNLPSGSHTNGNSASIAMAAAAAAAVAGYPLQFPNLSGHPLMAGQFLPPYLPSSTLNQLFTANQLSALSNPVSPKPSSPSIPSPHLSSSPRPVWASPLSNSNYHYKDTTTPNSSPPPQDVPLNLSKPKEKG